ncbi:MAG TPA: enolase C-terminal domain-like protein [Candidatus Acidoferrales bacterium]|nr:enolase C-terminal domain-like protein [Candidatus Acidoferrales bacterium]
MPDATIRSGKVSCYSIPTDAPEADGTFAWRKTVLVCVELHAANIQSLGYTYADAATGQLAQTLIDDVGVGCDAFDIPALWAKLVAQVRNLGREGVAAMAISAIDNSAWDLKSKLLDVPLSKLLGRVRDRIPVYGSGGFTSYSGAQLEAQFSGWRELGIRMMKMKVGSEPARDLHRVCVARKAAGEDVELFVDANGAYSRKQALWFAERFAELGVRWFEEPVSSDDLEGLHLIRDRAPAHMDIAAGEYGYNSTYFTRMIRAGAVDVLQADATRCLGITGMLAAGALCDAANLPMSAHCAPYLHAAPCCAIGRMRHVEFFHDHARIARMLFDGVEEPKGGALSTNMETPGIGLTLKMRDAEQFRI